MNRPTRKALRRLARVKAPRLYTLMTIAGGILADIGVLQIFAPAGVILAGVAIFAVGFVGLGLRGES